MVKTSLAAETSQVANKIFVIDTNVLIHHPKCLLDSFDEHDVYIPYTVLEELDGLKKEIGSVGRSAREAIKIIEKIGTGRKRGKDLGKMIITNTKSENKIPGESKPDNVIISSAIILMRKYPKRQIIFVSKDINARVKARSFRIKTQDYLKDQTRLFEKYGKVFSIRSNYTNGIFSVRYQKFDTRKYIKITGENNRSEALSVTDLFEKHFKLLGLNAEQDCALLALMDPSIKSVALAGVAGTGKTLLALAAGLVGIIEGTYDRIILTRCTVAVDKNELGSLPGDVNKKLTPWMNGALGNLDFLLENMVRPSKEEIKKLSEQGKRTKIFSCKKSEDLIKNGLVEMLPIDHVRGITPRRSYFVVEEAQNTTPHVMKTLGSRCGEGTKFITTGDFDQIDNHYLDKYSNGFSNQIAAFINEINFCYIKLSGVLRSELAEQFTRLM